MNVDTKMPLTQHLEELRRRVVISLIAIFGAFMLVYGFAEFLFDFLTRPLLAHLSDEVDLIGTGVTEAFFTKLKVSLIAATFLASPVVFFQAWQFIAPGLYESEKHYVRPFVFFATLFFFAGAGFCYTLVFPIAFDFFVSEFESIGVSAALRITEYLSFSARMLFAFGLVFELPVFTFFLARVGLIDHKMMIRWSRYAMVGSFVLAAILTPADAASQFLMAGPLIVLYGLSIGVAYLVGRRPGEAKEDETGAESEATEDDAHDEDADGEDPS